MKLDQKFYEEEVRCDYLVPAHMKRVWAIELELLEYFDKFCKKHGLTYFIDYGTLLGAVRHQGFIPWDDDVDVSMFRDDYERMKEIAATEIQEPYFLQTAHNDQMMFDFAKLRDSRSAAVEFYQFDENFNQGIFLDIKPWDDVPEDQNHTTQQFEMQKEMLLILTNPAKIVQMMQNQVPTTLPYELILQLLKMSPREVLREYENFNMSQMGYSEYMEVITSQIRWPKPTKRKEWAAETVELPFENLMLPAPVNYDAILRQEFGDYTQFPSEKYQHRIIFDPDRPYQEVIKEIREKGLPHFD